VTHAAAQVAPGIYRLGSSLVNFYLVEEDGRYTLVDAGLPGYFDQLPALMADLGADIHDIEAVVLTHGHSDHIGNAERVRTEAQARVYIHGADAQLARTAGSTSGAGTVLSDIWRPSAVRFIAHLMRNGGLKTPRVEDLTTFTEGATLDVPGRPQVIGTPGHSHGHCSFLLPDRGVLFAGDALCTNNWLKGSTGPQLMPRAVNASEEQALASLDRLEDVEAGVVLFGHGEPWTQGTRAAVTAARDRAKR
jgi:glyoxylase-like metal-dependent hydrolase (beta-lactamase superfamily II)